MNVQNGEWTFTGRHMLWTMIAFFGVIIAVNITMAVLASTSWTGLVAKNGYVASIDYAGDMAARKAVEQRGWHVEFGATDGILALVAFDGHREGVRLAPLEAVALRDLSRGDEHRRVLEKTAPGRWRATTPLPPGRWSVTVTLDDGLGAIDWRAVVSVGEAR